jgi:hypothetical protein
MQSLTPTHTQIDILASATRVAALLSESADLIATAGEHARTDSTLVGLARLTHERLAAARQHLATMDCSTVPQLLADAGTTLEAFRRLAAIAGNAQARALASLAGTYALDAAKAMSGGTEEQA